MKNSIEAGTSKKSFNGALITLIVAACILVGEFVYTLSERISSSDYVNQSVHLPQAAIPHDKPASKPGAVWSSVTIKSGDTLGSILKRADLNPNIANLLMKDKANSQYLTHLQIGEPIHLLIRQSRLEKMMLPILKTQDLELSWETDHYVGKIHQRAVETQDHYLTATIKNNLYSTAKRLNIPFNLINQMIDIFGWEVDFKKDIRDGDRFTMIYKARYAGNSLIGTGEIVAVSLTNHGKTHEAIRYPIGKGQYDYFTPAGESLKKAFDRYPIKFHHISSIFTLSRNHPILHRLRAHKGVDLAAPMGTPVRVTANGRIIEMHYENGYGNMIKIEHDKAYTTIYAHLLKFQKGLSRGDRVQRGQVIGYVGQSGLATGPHLHYEFHINHVPRNPTTAYLPKTAAIASNMRQSFKTHTRQLLAHLNLYESAHEVT